LLETNLSLELIKSTKDELLRELGKARKRCLEEQSRALETITEERIKIDAELKTKEELFNAHYQEKESCLAKDINEMRTEISTWREFKEGICKQFQEIKKLKEDTLKEKAQQAQERQWLFSKQKVDSSFLHHSPLEIPHYRNLKRP